MFDLFVPSHLHSSVFVFATGRKRVYLPARPPNFSPRAASLSFVPILFSVPSFPSSFVTYFFFYDASRFRSTHSRIAARAFGAGGNVRIFSKNATWGKIYAHSCGSLLFQSQDLIGGNVEDLTEVGKRLDRRKLIEPHIFAHGRGVHAEFFRDLLLRKPAPFDFLAQPVLNFR